MKTLITLIALIATAGAASAALVVTNNSQHLIDMETDVEDVFVANVGAEQSLSITEADSWRSSPFNSDRGPGWYSMSGATTHKYTAGETGQGNESATLFQADGNNDGDTVDDNVGNGGGAGMGVHVDVAGAAGNHAYRLSRDDDFAHSGFYLRIQNNTGATVWDWTFTADVYFGETNASNFSTIEFSYATDNGIDADQMSYTAFGTPPTVTQGDVVTNLAGAFSNTVTTAGVPSGNYIVLAIKDTFSAAGSEVYIDNIGVTPIASAVAEAPTGVTNLVATAVSFSEIDLSWDDTSLIEDGFIIERGPATNSLSVLATNLPNDTAFSDTGLTPTTEYFYRVTAFNAIGSSTNNPTASATTPALPPPAAPSDLEAAAVGSSAINLGWTDNSALETGSVIERKVGAGAFAPIATNAADEASFADTGLAASTEYTYRVKATNASGDSAYTAEASATTLSVGAGSNLVLYEPFVYGAAIGQPISTEAAWTDHDADGENGIVRGGLTMTGYPSAGKSVATDNNEVDYRSVGLNYFEDYGTLYLSGMFTASAPGTWGGSSLVQLSLSSDPGVGRLAIGLTNGDVIDGNGPSDKIHAFAGCVNAIQEITVEHDVAVATNNLTADTTYFVLAKLEITDNVSDLMDISLMVVEDGGTIPTNEPTSWDAVYTGASYTNYAIDSIWQNLDRLNVEQGNTPGTPGVSNIADEFRAAKTYDAALPVSAAVDPYDTWVALYGLTGDDALLETDVEPDGLDNLAEYGLGGNPTNADVAAVYPTSFIAEDAGSNYLYRTHNERTNDPTLGYTVGTKFNLVNNVHWDETDVELVGESAVVDDFKSVTNRTGISLDFKTLGLEMSK